MLFAIIMLAIFLQGVLRWQFSEETIKHDISQSLSQTNRAVTFNPGMNLDLLPRPSITLTGISISEPKSKQTAIKISKMELEFDWLDLFNKNPMPSRLVLNNLSTKIIRDQEGKLSIDDLLALRHENNSIPTEFKKFQLVDANVSIEDQATQKNLSLENINFFIKDHHTLNGRLDFRAKLRTEENSFDFSGKSEISRIKDGFRLNQFSFEGDTRILAYGQTKFNFVAQAEYKPKEHMFIIKDFNGNLDIDTPLLTLNATGTNWLIYPDRVDFPKINFKTTVKYDAIKEGVLIDGSLLNANLKGPLFKANEFQLNLKAASTSRTATLQSTSPLSLNLSSGDYVLEPINIKGRHLMSGKQIQGAVLGRLAGKLGENYHFSSDGSIENKNVVFTLNYQKEKLKYYLFYLDIEQLDATPIEPKQEEGISTAFFDSEQPFNLDFLNDKKILGQISIENLTTSKFQIQQLNAKVSAKPDEIAIDQIKASVYQGKLSGSSKLALVHGIPNLEINHSLIGVNIQPLLMDLFGYQRITGKGNGRIYLKAAALTPKKMRETLSGDINLDVKDGALLGVNLMETFQKSPTELQQLTQNQRIDETKKTVFSLLKGDSHLENGIARNRNLILNSELINLRGEGKLDLGKELIDYTMYITASPKLNRFKDVNVPLRITGDVITPTYSLDYAAMTKGKITKEEKQKALKDELLKQINGIIKR